MGGFGMGFIAVFAELLLIRSVFFYRTKFYVKKKPNNSNLGVFRPYCSFVFDELFKNQGKRRYE